MARTRPWIDSGGHWHGPTHRTQLGDLVRALAPYHSASAIATAIATDRILLQSDFALARDGGAEPLVLVPVYQPEHPRERQLLLETDWRLFPDLHPDARADQAMAEAVWSYLEARL